MASITLGGNPVNTIGDLPSVGAQAPDFTVTNAEVADVSSGDFRGKRVVLNIFPSINTGVCAASERKFNELAAGLANTTVLSVSKDLPFALNAFCAAEGIENVTPTSAFRTNFGEDFGVTMTDGKFAGLLARSVVVLDENGVVLHSELVPEIAQEPDYDAAIASLS
ncbi:MAG TPA: thiol peroxidase [Marmoricola sp.]|nr:thiol peroxidase [Marmoricola sp.]